MPDVTQILSEIEQGNAAAANELLPLVYEELRRLAASRLAQENPGQTLQATALVHDAYLRLVDVEQVRQWDSRGHFFSAAAEAMRRILVENARRRASLKRGGNLRRLELDAGLTVNQQRPEDILSLNEALERLAAEDPVKAELVKLRCFVGMSHQEAAATLGISRPTANRYWAYAKARGRRFHCHTSVAVGEGENDHAIVAGSARSLSGCLSSATTCRCLPHADARPSWSECGGNAAPIHSSRRPRSAGSGTIRLSNLLRTSPPFTDTDHAISTCRPDNRNL